MFIVIGQYQVKGNIGNSCIWEFWKIGDDLRFADSNLSAGPKTYRLPYSHVTVPNFRNPVPANRAKHRYILANIPCRSSIFIKIAQGSQLRMGWKPGKIKRVDFYSQDIFKTWSDSTV